MWLVVTRAAAPDAAYWPGRRWLAAADALAWPLLWMLVLWRALPLTGIVGPMAFALAALTALGRVRRALWVNHRYRFTTRRWGRAALALPVVGVILKVMPA